MSLYTAETQAFEGERRISCARCKLFFGAIVTSEYFLNKYHTKVSFHWFKDLENVDYEYFGVAQYGWIGVNEKKPFKSTVIHELAHSIFKGANRGHGKLFCAAYLDLTQCFMPEYSEELKSCFIEHKIQY